MNVQNKSGGTASTMAYYTQREVVKPGTGGASFMKSHYKKVFQERRGTEGLAISNNKFGHYQTHTVDQMTQLQP